MQRPGPIPSKRRVPLPDLSDVLLALGVALVAWTVYLQWPLWTPAVVGLAFLIAGVMRGVTSSGPDRPSR